MHRVITARGAAVAVRASGTDPESKAFHLSSTWAIFVAHPAQGARVSRAVLAVTRRAGKASHVGELACKNKRGQRYIAPSLGL